MDLTLTDLGRLGAVLGDGREAKVLEAPQLSLPDLGAPLVVKRYKQPQALGPALDNLIRARLALDARRRTRLDGISAWPLRRVVDRGSLVGVVMPRVPPSFFTQMRLPSGLQTTGPREAQWLFSPEHHLSATLQRPPLTAIERRRICRDFAAALTFLHDEMDVVLGDISARNTLVRFRDRPAVMFVDCDAARRRQDRTKQMHSPDWEPLGRSIPDRGTDLYKLGLFVLRTLTPGDRCSVNREPDWASAALDTAGMALLRRAVGPVPADRPAAAEWFAHLAGALGEPVRPPRLRAAGLSRSLVAPGDTITVEWDVEEACQVSVCQGGRALMTVRADTGPGSVEIGPLATGTLRVRTSNALGADELFVGSVVVLSDPAVASPAVPLPEPDLRVRWPEFPPAALPCPAERGALPPPPPWIAAPANLTLPAPRREEPAAGPPPILAPPPWWAVAPSLPEIETGPCARGEVIR